MLFLAGLITSQIPGSAWCEDASGVFEAEFRAIRDRCSSFRIASALKEIV